MVQFKVSVVLPVYNAAPYLKEAVDSALQFSCVTEVIMIEDGSKDNSLEVCKALELQYPKIKLITHPNNANKGAGPTRTLGIQAATNNYVCFLDADDFYLPNRFDKDKEIFESDDSVDGVYNASAYLIDSEYARKTVSMRYKVLEPEKFLYTVREEICKEDIFYYLLNGGKGHFHTNAITLKKSIFKKTGYFANLKLHQDTHMWMRIALYGKLRAGNITSPTAKIRVHENNRIKHSNRNTVYEYYYSLYNDIGKDIKENREYSTLIKKVVSNKARLTKNQGLKVIYRIIFMIQHFILHPKDIFRINLKSLLN